MNRTIKLAGLAVLALVAAWPAAAQATNDQENCANEERHLSPVDQIASCTAILSAKGASLEHRVIGYGMRGETLQAMGKNADALADYNEALKLRQTGYGYLVRGELLEETGQTEKALADFEAGLKLEPNNGRLYLDRGDVRLMLKQYPGAIADADKASQLSPNSSVGHNGRCWKRVVANTDLDVARAACDQALRLSADNEDKVAALDSRGVLSLRQKRWADAEKDFAAGVALDANAGRVLFGRGVARMRQGNTKDGEADMKRAATLFQAVGGMYRDYGLWP